MWSRPSEILLTTKLVEVTEFLLSYLISWEMMLLKCCTQYASKFGKLSNGHRTRRGQFSFQSQRKAMTKNVQTNIKLCSFHKPARLCSKFFKLGFSSMQTENFQMFKLVLEKAEEPEIKMPTSEKAKEFHTVLTVWITTNCGKVLKRWEYQTTLPVSWETCMWVKKQQLKLDIEQLSGSKLGKEYDKAVNCHSAYLAYMQSTSWEIPG